MTNTAAASPAQYFTAYENGALSTLLAALAEAVIEDRTTYLENWGYEDWSSVESAREFHSHLRSLRVEVSGPGRLVVSSRPSEHGAWTGTAAEILDAASSRVPSDLLVVIAADHGGVEPEIFDLAPGVSELRFW